MQSLQVLLVNENRKYVKTGGLLATAYFFLGISEGAFLFFDSSPDAAINFAFTLVCVFSNWWLFKRQYQATAHFLGLRRYLSYIVVVLALSVFTTLLNWVYIELLWQEELRHTAFFPVVLPLAVLLFTAWALGYPWLKGLEKGQRKTSELVEFEVKKGRHTVFCSLEQTLGFMVVNKLVFLLTAEGQRLLIDRSLSDLEEELVAYGFFRINRQVLLSPKSIKAYRTVENERIELTLVNSIAGPQPCYVSRYKAPAFRQWLNEHRSFSY